jgi:glycine cleavage system aminomethyltransferase T
LIDVSPLIKYVIKGKDAAALLHRVTTRDIHKMKVGQVAYTGWCDEEGKLIDDGTVSRLEEADLPPDCRGTESALADDERRRHGCLHHRSDR